MQINVPFAATSIYFPISSCVPIRGGSTQVVLLAVFIVLVIIGKQFFTISSFLRSPMNHNLSLVAALTFRCLFQNKIYCLPTPFSPVSHKINHHLLSSYFACPAHVMPNIKVTAVVPEPPLKAHRMTERSRRIKEITSAQQPNWMEGDERLNRIPMNLNR